MSLESLLNDIDDNSDEISSMEAFEMENLVRKYPQKFPALAQKIRQSDAMPKSRNNISDAKVFSSKQLSNPVMAAQFDIVVTRNTNLIASPLPYAIFGSQDAENGYRVAIAELLPAGVTLTSVRYGENASQPNAVRFTYTQGANVDTIDVICNQYSYPAFLRGAIADMFNLEKIRLSLQDATALGQLNQPIIYRERSIFGKDNKQNLPVISAKSPLQFQNGILDVDGSFNFDKETMLVGAMINHTAAFSFTISAFVKRFLKWNANGF